jgi:hypothetical protein
MVAARLPREDPEVAWRYAILFPRLLELDPGRSLPAGFTRVRDFPERNYYRKLEMDPPRVTRLKIPKPGGKGKVSEPKAQYEERQRQAAEEWKRKKQAERTSRSRTETWQCIDCGDEIPYEHFRCLPCLSAYTYAAQDVDAIHRLPGVTDESDDESESVPEIGEQRVRG